MLNKLSLRAKLLILTNTLAFGLLIAGVVSSYLLNQVSLSADHVASVNFAKFRQTALIKYYATNLAKNYLRLLIPGLSPREIVAIKKSFNDDLENILKIKNDYAKMSHPVEEEDLNKAENAAWVAFRDFAQEFVALDDKKRLSTEFKDAARYQLLVSKLLTESRTLHTEAINKLMEYEAQDADEWIKKSRITALTGSRLTWSLTIILFIAAVAFGFTFSRSLSTSLRELAKNLTQGSEQVASISQKVASSSEQLSSATNEQAASLQETSASVEQMSAMITKNSENASRSQEVFVTTQEITHKGKEVVAQMLKSMDDINLSNDDIMRQIEISNQNISEIVKVIAEIGNKTKVINDIVFQTKLLSFNASVEAARAGEHGKGFAVVAEEIGGLAQMSGAAAKDISLMLDDSTKKVEAIVQETKVKVESLAHVGKEKVSMGSETAKQCSVTLNEIARSIEEVSRKIAEITSASKEQATGVSQINQAMGQLDQATQQNAAGAQLTAGASEELSLQAETLREMVVRLNRMVEGNKNINRVVQVA